MSETRSCVSGEGSALDLFLQSDISVVTALSLSAVGGLERKSGVAFSADHLVALVLSGESGKNWLDLHGTHTTTSKSEDEMESGLFLDVVIRESSTVFKLLSGEDESLLIWGNTFFILNLSFDVFDGVSRLDVKGNCFTS